jgi:hypothetical protein
MWRQGKNGGPMKFQAFGNPNAAFGLNVRPVAFELKYDTAREYNAAMAKKRAAQKRSNAQDHACAQWFKDLTSEEVIPLEFYPTESNWLPDRRHSHLRSVWPVGWPQFPRGYYGITLPSSANHEQSTQWRPTDPRLVAVNWSGPGSMGTPVADLGGKNHSLDFTRHAPLQSMLRVIPSPVGKGVMLDKNKKSPAPRAWLARNIGPAGQWDVSGGLVCDMPTGRTGTIAKGAFILAMESCIYGGPFDVGHYGDAHQIGIDGDDRPINSLHISTEALFKRRGSWLEDGPLYFEDIPYEECDDLRRSRLSVAGPSCLGSKQYDVAVANNDDGSDPDAARHAEPAAGSAARDPNSG